MIFKNDAIIRTFDSIYVILDKTYYKYKYIKSLRVYLYHLNIITSIVLSRFRVVEAFLIF